MQPTAATTALEAVTVRIRNRNAQKACEKAHCLQPERTARGHTKPVPIVISDSGSDEDSSPTGNKTAAQPPIKSTSKLAPPTESYSRAEMKSFAKMAKAIRNTSDIAHVTATVNFLDAEFSDNSGRAARVLSSPFAWKRNRFKEIASKAAKILEDRYVMYLLPCAHATTCLLCVHTQSPPFQQGRYGFG